MEFGDARLPQRYWDKVKIDEESGCWLWTASTDPYGYGYFSWEGKLRKAHRVMVQALTGAWPGSSHVLHSCDTPPCVRPDHLRKGSHSDNMRDRAARGRAPRQNATHCPAGHEYTPDNVSSNTSQGRKCKACNRIRMRKVQA